MRLTFMGTLVVLVLGMVPMVGMEDPREPQLPKDPSSAENFEISLQTWTWNFQAQQELLEAILANNAEAAKNALEQGASPSSWSDYTDNEFFGPPLFCVLDGIDTSQNEEVQPSTLKIIELLLDFGADINAVFRARVFPLRVCLEKANNTKIVTFLLDHGASIWKKQAQLVSALKSKKTLTILVIYGLRFNDWLSYMASSISRSHNQRINGQDQNGDRSLPQSNMLYWLLIRKAPIDHDEVTQIINQFFKKSLLRCIIYHETKRALDRLEKIVSKQESLEKIGQTFLVSSPTTVTLVNKAFKMAAAYGNKDIILFIGRKLGSLLKPKTLREAFWRATLTGSLPILKMLYEEGAIEEKAAQQRITYALVIAAVQRHEDVAAFLLELDHKLASSAGLIRADDLIGLIKHLDKLLQDQHMPLSVRSKLEEIKAMISGQLDRRVHMEEIINFTLPSLATSPTLFTTSKV